MVLCIVIFNTLFGEFWGHYNMFTWFYPCFACLCSQNVLFANYCLVFFSFLLTDKNLRFLSQRRREGVIGDANGSISKIRMGIVLLSCSNVSIAIQIKFKSQSVTLQN